MKKKFWYIDIIAINKQKENFLKVSELTSLLDGAVNSSINKLLIVFRYFDFILKKYTNEIFFEDFQPISFDTNFTDW